MCVPSNTERTEHNEERESPASIEQTVNRVWLTACLARLSCLPASSLASPLASLLSGRLGCPLASLLVTLSLQQ